MTARNPKPSLLSVIRTHLLSVIRKWRLMWALKRSTRQILDNMRPDSCLRREREREYAFCRLRREDAWFIDCIPLFVRQNKNLQLSRGGIAFETALMLFGHDAFDALLPLLQSHDPQVRGDAAHFLGLFGAMAEPHLVRMLFDPDYGVALAAAGSLKEILKRTCSRSRGRQIELAVSLLKDEEEERIKSAFMAMDHPDGHPWGSIPADVMQRCSPRTRDILHRVNEAITARDAEWRILTERIRKAQDNEPTF